MESERQEIRWLTVDGPLGLGSQDTESARRQARNFFYAGFAFLPWLWFVNCFYFWPILRRSYHPDPFLRSYVVRSAIGFVIYTAVLLIWALTFAIGGKSLFGASWENLVLYRLADNFDLTGNL